MTITGNVERITFSPETEILSLLIDGKGEFQVHTKGATWEGEAIDLPDLLLNLLVYRCKVSFTLLERAFTITNTPIFLRI